MSCIIANGQDIKGLCSFISLSLHLTSYSTLKKEIDQDTLTPDLDLDPQVVSSGGSGKVETIEATSENE